MKYTIYLRTNTVNNKQYVGQTGNFKQREYEWNCFKKTYANEHIDEDREKYGLDAWAVETLAETDSREDAWELEQRFIKDFNTKWPNGYNLDSGGLIGKNLSEETKKKMSEELKGENNPKYWLGKHRSEETKQKISEALKGENHPRFGKPSYNRKQVFQYTLDGKLVAIWPSATDAEKELGIKQSSISECCHGKRKSAGGFKWSFNPL